MPNLCLSPTLCPPRNVKVIAPKTISPTALQLLMGCILDIINCRPSPRYRCIISNNLNIKVQKPTPPKIPNYPLWRTSPIRRRCIAIQERSIPFPRRRSRSPSNSKVAIDRRAQFTVVASEIERVEIEGLGSGAGDGDVGVVARQGERVIGF